MAVKKVIGGEERVVGHVPRRISAICSLFIRRGGRILCTVSGSRRYSADLPQGGVAIPMKLIFTATRKQEATKAKKLIEGTLCINVTRDVASSEERVEAISEAQGTSNSASPAVTSCKPGQSVSATDEVNLIDHELHTVEEPPKKRLSLSILRAYVIMGNQLTDIEINVAQLLLKKQFPKLNGLASGEKV